MRWLGMSGGVAWRVACAGHEVKSLLACSGERVWQPGEWFFFVLGGLAWSRAIDCQYSTFRSNGNSTAVLFLTVDSDSVCPQGRRQKGGDLSFPYLSVSISNPSRLTRNPHPSAVEKTRVCGAGNPFQLSRNAMLSCDEFMLLLRLARAMFSSSSSQKYSGAFSCD